MLRIILSCAIAVALAAAPSNLIASAEDGQHRNSSEAEVKQTIKDIGEGYQSRVKITLKDGTKIEGYISTVADDGFAVTNPKTSKTIKVAYGDVAKVSKQKPPRTGSGRPIVAIIGGIAIVVFAFAVYFISDRKG
ncbi:MAG: hypothetical protein AABO41_05085 [Acidobacteriota bacterium]